MYQLQNGLEQYYELVDVPSPKVSLGWSVFHNALTNETVGLTISNRRTEGFKRVKAHRQEIDFRTVTVSELQGLVEKHCPYVKIKPIEETESVENGYEGEGETKNNLTEGEEQKATNNRKKKND